MTWFWFRCDKSTLNDFICMNAIYLLVKQRDEPNPFLLSNFSWTIQQFNFGSLFFPVRLWCRSFPVHFINFAFRFGSRNNEENWAIYTLFVVVVSFFRMLGRECEECVCVCMHFWDCYCSNVIKNGFQL